MLDAAGSEARRGRVAGVLVMDRQGKLGAGLFHWTMELGGLDYMDVCTTSAPSPEFRCQHLAPSDYRKPQPTTRGNQLLRVLLEAVCLQTSNIAMKGYCKPIPPPTTLLVVPAISAMPTTRIQCTPIIRLCGVNAI
jgi:hypothetical protein